MKGGEIKVQQRIREIIRFAGIILPFSLAIISLFPGVDKPYALEPSKTLSIVMIPWLVLSLLMFVYPARTKKDIIVRLGAYHVCASAFVLLISGFLLPFVPLGWALLLLVSYMYLSRLGIIINVATLVAVAITDILISKDSSEEIAMNIIAVLSILMVGLIIVTISRIQRADSEELVESRAQESLQSGRMNTLINNLADAVITINDEGKVEVFNAASLNLLNTNVGLKDQFIDDVIKIEDQSGKAVKLFQMAKKARGVRIRDDVSLVIDDDEALRLEVTASPVRSNYSRSKGEGSSDGYILILRDITKSKSLEEERDEFISVVSHELRTPITIAEGTISNVQLMLQKDKVPPGTLERGLADAHEQIIFLSKMVNDLSTLSRAERGVADVPEVIDVKELIDSLYNEYAPQAKKKSLLFDVDAHGKLGTVTASRLYVHELLQNLITNAIKYTKEGSITIHVTRDEKQVLFEVKDTGIGISKGDQAKIFNKFYRSEDYRTRETGGTGLGLYVAAKLSKKLGTQVRVTSRLNYGSNFSFSLPASSESPIH